MEADSQDWESVAGIVPSIHYGLLRWLGMEEGSKRPILARKNLPDRLSAAPARSKVIPLNGTQWG